MRIAYYVRDFPGSDDYQREYTEAAVRLSNQGHQVTALSVSRESTELPSWHRGVRIEAFDGAVRVGESTILSSSLVAARRAARWVSRRRDEIDVLMAAEWWSAVPHILARSALRAGIPAVVAPWDALHEHAMARGRVRPIVKRQILRALRAFYGDRQPTLQLYGSRDGERLPLIGLPWPHFRAPLGIYDDYEESPAPPDWERILGSPPSGRRTLFFNARLDIYRKGIDYLLEGVSEAASQPSVETPPLVLLSGVDPTGRLAGQLPMVAKMAKPLCESGQALWLGFLTREDRRDLISHSDMFLYPSRHDGPPRPLREALYRGTPLMVTYETGLGEWIEEYEAGIVVTRTDAGALRDAIVRFATTSDEELSRMSTNARRLASRLAWSECWRDYEAGLQMAVENFSVDRGAPSSNAPRLKSAPSMVREESQS